MPTSPSALDRSVGSTGGGGGGGGEGAGSTLLVSTMGGLEGLSLDVNNNNNNNNNNRVSNSPGGVGVDVMGSLAVGNNEINTTFFGSSVDPPKSPLATGGDMSPGGTGG